MYIPEGVLIFIIATAIGLTLSSKWFRKWETTREADLIFDWLKIFGILIGIIIFILSFFV